MVWSECDPGRAEDPPTRGNGMIWSIFKRSGALRKLPEGCVFLEIIVILMIDTVCSGLSGGLQIENRSGASSSPGNQAGGWSGCKNDGGACASPFHACGCPMSRFSSIPVLVPVFNNPTYLAFMIEQLRAKHCSNIHVYDNGSTFPPMLALLERLEASVTLHRLARNLGPRLFSYPEIYNPLPEFFVITDPDLAFNPALPEDFLAQLHAVTQQFKVFKAGFALEIATLGAKGPRIRVDKDETDVVAWEARFWKEKIGQTAAGDAIYRANIDTTFALYCKANLRYRKPFLRKMFGANRFSKPLFLKGLRVAGRFSCKHLPWFDDFPVPEDERLFYARQQQWSTRGSL